MSNLAEKEKELKGLETFVRSLKFASGNLVSAGNRKTVVIGFTATIRSTIALAWDVLTSENSLSHICTRLTQQDPLEHFFSMIRLRGGLNNNPTAVQVKYIMRKLLVIKSGGVTPSLSSNCSIPAHIVEGSDGQTETDLDLEMEIDIEIFDSDQDLNSSLIDDSFRNQCLAFIAGYVVLKIERHFDCNLCRNALYNNPDDPLDQDAAKIANLKRNRVSCLPSNSVYNIVRECESVFQSMLSQGLKSQECNIIAVLTNQVLKTINVNEMFPNCLNHFEKCNVNYLVKSVVFRFLKVRCLSFLKMFNQNLSDETSKRNQLTKLILYKNL